MPARRPDSSRRRVALALLAAPLGAALGCNRREPSPESLPDVGYTLLDGSQGSTLHLRGKVALVNFWATTCPVCVKEMPQLVELHQHYGPRGLTTLAVAMQWDPPARVSQYAESRRLPFGVAIDHTGAIARAFGDVKATPTTFLIDRHGRVAERREGALADAALRASVERLLGAQ